VGGVAVFQAFKEVELSVRNAANMNDSDIGRKLMQTAFNPENGPLTDTQADKGERVGLMDLYSGAIGHCKKSAGASRARLWRDLANAGAIAFKRSGDPMMGDFSDAVVIKTFGEVPEKLDEL
jgi:hypothetical protein